MTEPNGRDPKTAGTEPNETPDAGVEPGKVAESGIDAWLVPCVTDSTLWPILVVALAVAVCLGVALVTLAWSDRNPLGVVGILALGWMSFDMVKRERSSGGSGWVTRLVLTIWFLIAGCSATLIGLGWI